MTDIGSRRGILALCGLMIDAALAGCSGESATNASTATASSGDFDFAGNTPLGEVIPPAQRESAPTFTGELLDGTAFESAELAGEITVLNFWGSWCAPCRVETPEFQAVYADVADSGVEFLGVDVKDNRQMAQAFVESVGAEYPSLFDPRGEVAMAFRGFPANVVPSTILIDPAGQVAAVYVAVVPEDDLRRAIDRLLAEETPR